MADDLFSSRRARKVKAEASTDGPVMSQAEKERAFALTSYARHIEELQPHDSITLVPKGELSFEWHLTPSEGMWKGATYVFDVQLPNDFPYTSPSVTLKTPIWHPNIDVAGKPCVSVLQKGWLPTHMLSYVMYGLLYLFDHPNPDDPLNIKAAEQMRTDTETFKKTVQDYLKKAKESNKA